MFQTKHFNLRNQLKQIDDRQINITLKVTLKITLKKERKKES